MIIEERCTEIEKANRILLERMASIMSAHPPQNQSVISNQYLSVKRVNNPISQGLVHDLTTPVNANRSKSLNRTVRRRETDRISNENSSILRRLQDQKSYYNTQEWKQDRKKKIKIIKQICYYPPTMIKKIRHRSKRRNIYTEDPNQTIYNMYQDQMNNSGNPLGDENQDSPYKDQEENQEGITNIQIDETKGADNQIKQKYGIENYQTNQLMIAHQDIKRDIFSQQVERSSKLKDLNQTAPDTIGNETSFDQQQLLLKSNTLNQQIPNNPSQGQTFQTQQNSQQINNFIVGSNNQMGFKNPNLIANKRPPPMALGYNDYAIDQTRQVLYRNFHQIDHQIFLVEISRDPKKVFFIIFPNYEKPEINQIVVMAEKQAIRLMNENNNLFEEFVKRFYLHFGKFQISGYHNKNSLNSSRMRLGSVRREIQSVSPNGQRRTQRDFQIGKVQRKVFQLGAQFQNNANEGKDQLDEQTIEQKMKQSSILNIDQIEKVEESKARNNHDISQFKAISKESLQLQQQKFSDDLNQRADTTNYENDFEQTQEEIHNKFIMEQDEDDADEQGSQQQQDNGQTNYGNEENDDENEDNQ
ncbi:UNKNOWN [Stylonychia lemnae]|uniref:Uncharacterized protein n=1 Tax=Stylonychia lemnae TaxID=5949 RepID=A0A078AL96_STYLE|nr:UNKNOWN [Stylonychia lemnae]|eukprot:CDW82974.1 UNKNOWN [Stylonychia lemnae]